MLVELSPYDCMGIEYHVIVDFYNNSVRKSTTLVNHILEIKNSNNFLYLGFFSEKSGLLAAKGPTSCRISPLPSLASLSFSVTGLKAF